MSAVQELEAAIAVLEEFKARGYEVVNGWLVEIDDSIKGDDPRRPLTNDEYIVTLHRTIDAQLAMLRLEHQQAERYGWPANPFMERDAVLALARAILGGIA